MAIRQQRNVIPGSENRRDGFTEEILEDIDKETIPWGPKTTDDSLQIPLVMPAKFPESIG